MSAKPGMAARREAEVRGGLLPTLTLLRHGEPDWAPAGGATVGDPGLTPYGRAQADAAARALAARRIDALYVSPYRRAQETAAPLAERIGVTPVTLPELAEIGVRFEGLTQEAVDRVFVEASRRPLDEHWQGWPGGERLLISRLMSVGTRTRQPFSARRRANWDSVGTPSARPQICSGV